MQQVQASLVSAVLRQQPPVAAELTWPVQYAAALKTMCVVQCVRQCVWSNVCVAALQPMCVGTPSNASIYLSMCVVMIMLSNCLGSCLTEDPDSISWQLKAVLHCRPSHRACTLLQRLDSRNLLISDGYPIMQCSPCAQHKLHKRQVTQGYVA